MNPTHSSSRQLSSFTKAFDELWADMDRHYSYFSIKQDVDWKALRRHYRPRVAKAASVEEFVEVLREMLAHLKDMHVWIAVKGKVIPTYRIPWKPNFNLKVALAQLAEEVEINPFAIVGTTKRDRFGYLVIIRQSNATKALVRRTVAEIRKRRDASGFIVDLRVGCNGGNELLARFLAAAFCERETVYAKHRYRNNRRHDAFGPICSRVLMPSSKPFTKTVICLIGPGCISSGEALVLMMRSLPHVITIGEATRGASGNPRPHQVQEFGFSVWFSRWVDMDTEGIPFEGTGIHPAIAAKSALVSDRGRDVTLERATALLR